jgi:hypothetical protein
MRRGGMSHPDGFRGLGASRSLLVERFPWYIAVRSDEFVASGNGKETAMKRMALVCAFFLALGFTAMAIAPDSGDANSVPRLVSGIMDGRFAFAGPWEGPWTTTGEVTGTLRHLGLSKLHTQHTASPDGTLSDGTFTIEAANGDTLWGSYEAAGEWISDSEVQGNAQFAIAGGTGRFAGATGTLTASFLETFDDPSFASAGVTWALVGTVNY